MKFYKVNPEKLVGETLGNSTMPTYNYSPICREEYIKVSSDGATWTGFNKPIWSSRRMKEDRSQLFITSQELAEFFDECEDPGPKTISNIKFVVGTVNYENFDEVESFTDATEAVHVCQNFNDTDPNEYYEVRVEFDAKWEK